MSGLKTVFRYPGGKVKLVNSILPEIDNLLQHGWDERNDPFVFVDVFVGGGSVSLAVADRYPFAEIYVNDLDEWINAFWRTMSRGNVEKLKGLVTKYDPPTLYTFNGLRDEIKSGKGTLDMETKAFIALFFNRTTFSGIFSSGPIGGQSQGGKYKIDCRYNAKKILKQLDQIKEAFRDRKVLCYKKNFSNVIKKYMDNEDAVLYLDPPYMVQGKQLYNHFMEYEDYEEMASLLKQSKCKWIVSHDDNSDFVDFYEGWSDIKTIEGVPYTINSIKDKRRTELLICSRNGAK